MEATRRVPSGGLWVGAVLLWVVAAVALWVLLLRGGQDQVALQYGEEPTTSLFVVGVLSVLVLVGAVGSLLCGERLSTGAARGALVTVGAGVLVLVVIAAAALLTQVSIGAAVADAALVPGATSSAQVVSVVVAMVLAVTGTGAVLLGLRRVRAVPSRPDRDGA